MTDLKISSEANGVVSRKVTIPPDIDLVRILGTSDQILRIVENGFPDVQIVVVERAVTLKGSKGKVALVADFLGELIALSRAGTILDEDAVRHAVSLLVHTESTRSLPSTVLSARGKSIRPRSEGQASYVEAIERSPIVFGIGPAGTGKTYLAVAQAVSQLLSGQVRRIVLTRPAVEAGENLGFLPGTLTEKIDPYLRPLLDALGDMLDAELVTKMMAAGSIEVAPLAYMRGRTLNDSFIILDEAQNTTVSQMKMFLTRLGFKSQMVITGDITQVDLPGSQRSGLMVIRDILNDIEGVEFCYLTSADVVRHRLVGEIIDAYARWDDREARRAQERPASSRLPHLRAHDQQ